MSDATDRDVQVHHERDTGRYIVTVDGIRAGLTEYHVRGGRHLFVHTEVDPAFGGMGVGGRLIEFALDDVRSHGGKVVPICPFVAHWIEQHPDYGDLVDVDIMERLDSH